MSVLSVSAVQVAWSLPNSLRHKLTKLKLRKGSDILRGQLDTWLSNEKIDAETTGLITFNRNPEPHFELTQLGIEVSQLLHSCCCGTCCEREQSTRELTDHIVETLRTIGTSAHWNFWSLRLTSSLSASELELLGIEHIINDDWRLTLYGYHLIWSLASGNIHREG